MKKVTSSTKRAKVPFHLKSSLAIAKRHRREIERLRGVIAEHETALAGELTIAERGHHTASKRFRELDLTRSEKIVELYASIERASEYKDAPRRLEIIQIEHDRAAALVHYDMYVWQAEQYADAGNPGNAARCHKEAERAKANADHLLRTTEERLAFLEQEGGSHD
jgi:hypothetical protein